jgi:hypothetical protein
VWNDFTVAHDCQSFKGLAVIDTVATGLSDWIFTPVFFAISFVQRGQSSA